MKMKVVYLAHPFSASPAENVERVTQIAKGIIQYSQTTKCSTFYSPIVPHLLLSVYAEETNTDIRHITEELSSALVRSADELWIVSDQLSAGMKLEVEAAHANGIRVRKWSEVLKLIPDLQQEANA